EHGGVQDMPGEAWHPYQGKYFVTPPFAEYPSGHSVFSGAAAEILERFRKSRFFGASVVVPAGASKIETGAPAYDIELRWATFYDASREAGMSRLYGGIHFEKGNLDGLSMGEQVAQKVWQKCTALWQGRF
ncbi:MAG: phosphoesterase, partial [Bacteroidota bacterium]